MRSNLFASTLAIALGVTSPIVGAIGFPEIAIAGFSRIPTTLEVEQKTQENIKSLKQTLTLYKQKKDQKSEAEAIGLIANLYFKIGKLKEAELTILDSISEIRKSKDLIHEKLLIEILQEHLTKDWKFSAGFGDVQNREIERKYQDGELSWEEVLNFSNFNLSISRLVGDRLQEAESLHGLGWAYRNLGKFYDAISYYEQANSIVKDDNNIPYGSFLHVEVGLIYTDIGLHDKALENFNLSLSKSLGLNKIDKNKSNMLQRSQLRGFALTKLGMTYISLRKYDEAFKYLQDALKEDFTIDIQNTLLGIGIIYENQENYSLALEQYEKSLGTIVIGDPNGKGMVLNRIGLLYIKQQNYEKAIDAFQKALVSLRSLKNSPEEAVTLSNIAFLVENQKQTELAITFYKESVNITESIRQNLRRMTTAEQRAYTESISKTYRSLANLLLSQGRVLEAQQVLELLKNQELRDYTKDTRSTSPTNGSPLNPLEAPIPAAFNDKISLGNQLAECDRQKCTDRSKLNSQVTNANKTFIALVTKLKDRLRSQEIKDPAQLQTDKLTIAAQKVILANPNVKTVLVYPLVLEDKLWLVWGSQAGKSGVIFDSKEIPVTRKDLSEKVRQLQEKLSNPNSNPKELQQVSQQLYQWLIQPIRQQLNDNKVQQIVFSLDRATRYIPMAALHDGKQYLAENFALSTILTAEIDTTDKLAPNPQDSSILGLGLTQAIAGLNALPAVETEINAIVRTDPTSQNGIYPGTKLFNQDFTEQSLRDNISGRRILHIATHGSFVPGNPEDSFLVLGNGQKLSISAIKSITDLANTHLVVLSACETGKGGVDKEGIEVAGLGHYFLLSGAKSVLASLWLVNDPATSLLMNRFYTNLSQGKLSKAEALRQVQIAFINGKLTDTEAKALNRAGVRLYREGQLPHGSFAHPYYWAPFILIGNNL